MPPHGGNSPKSVAETAAGQDGAEQHQACSSSLLGVLLWSSPTHRRFCGPVTTGLPSPPRPWHHLRPDHAGLGHHAAQQRLEIAHDEVVPPRMDVGGSEARSRGRQEQAQTRLGSPSARIISQSPAAATAEQSRPPIAERTYSSTSEQPPLRHASESAAACCCQRSRAAALGLAELRAAARVTNDPLRAARRGPGAPDQPQEPTPTAHPATARPPQGWSLGVGGGVGRGGLSRAGGWVVYRPGWSPSYAALGGLLGWVGCAIWPWAQVCWVPGGVGLVSSSDEHCLD